MKSCQLWTTSIIWPVALYLHTTEYWEVRPYSRRRARQDEISKTSCSLKWNKKMVCLRTCMDYENSFWDHSNNYSQITIHSNTIQLQNRIRRRARYILDNTIPTYSLQKVSFLFDDWSSVALLTTHSNKNKRSGDQTNPLISQYKPHEA